MPIAHRALFFVTFNTHKRRSRLPNQSGHDAFIASCEKGMSLHLLKGLGRIKVRSCILRFRQLRAESRELRGDVLMCHWSVHEIFVAFFLDLFAPDFTEKRARPSVDGAAELRA